MTSLEDVKVAAAVSGSQMYHYFPDKNELVQAVIDYQADAIISNNRQALAGANGMEAWRDMVTTGVRAKQARGGCELGSLGGQLSESDPEARALIADGFDRWAAVISDGLRALDAEGRLRRDIDPDDLATTLLATLQGGLLLVQVPGSAATRERILEAASELFYADGLHAVSADRIIERVGIAKVTFHRHFRTKDDLLVAYLGRRAVLERDALIRAREGAVANAMQAFDALAAAIGDLSCQPGFRGCPFINAAAEYGDRDHPVRQVVDEHRRWFRDEAVEMLRALGVAGVEEAADEVVMLRDGAMVTGYLGDASAVSSALASGFRAVIDAHSASRPQG